MTLELKRFEMSEIKFDPNENKGPVVVLIGRRDTGKSYLVRDLLYYHQDIPIGTVISGTEAGNGFYGNHVPKLFIHDEYSSSIIANILKRQKVVLKQINKLKLDVIDANFQKVSLEEIFRKITSDNNSK